MKRKGFTLIELLVVIAIIAILAAILFPVFAKAREKARQSSCQNNLKQMAIGIQQYTADFDERYPGRHEGTEFDSWRRNIQPYVKNEQVFVCPSNQHATDLAGDSSNGVPAGMPVFHPSYGCNGHDWQNCPMEWGDRARKLSAIASPAQLILITESNNGWNEMNLDGAYDWGYGNPWLPSLFAGHMGNTNFAFADGHVKAMKPSQTLSVNPQINMWNVDGPNMAPNNAAQAQQMVNVTTFYANR